MLLSDFIKESVSAISTVYSENEARNIILLLCEETLGTKRYTHIIEPEYTVPNNKKDILAASVVRLMEGEPIQYVLGHTEFCGYTYKVNSDVLIPRPETEELVNHAVQEATRIQRMRSVGGKDVKAVRVLDLCTGSGCIAWSVAMSAPGTKVVGVDISESALKLAESQFSVTSKRKEIAYEAPKFLQADILDTEQDFPYSEFDLILSNPPYIMEKEKEQMRVNVLNYEPALALFVPDDDPLVFYKALAKWSKRLLSPKGMVIVEINEKFAYETIRIFKHAGFNEIKVMKDMFSKDRFISFKR